MGYHLLKQQPNEQVIEMEIAVLVTEVAELTGEFEFDDDSSIPVDQVTYQLNEFDAYAIEAAVRLKESLEECTVTAVTIGPERATEVLRTALGKGADAAIRVWDDTLEDDQLTCPRWKGNVLARVLERESPDIVFAGVQSEDHAFAATGVITAHELSYEWATIVRDFDVHDGTVEVQRELEGDVVQQVRIELPAVLTVQTGINEPRYASLREIRRAQNVDIHELTVGDVGVDRSDSSDGFELQALETLETNSDAEYFTGDADESAAQLAELLSKRGVIS